MSGPIDPYRPPTTEKTSDPVRPAGSAGPEFSDELFQNAKSMRAWQVLIAIVGAVISGLLAISGLVSIARSAFKEANGPQSTLGMATIILVGIAVWGIPTWSLFQSVARSKRFAVDRDPAAIAALIHGQKQFWQRVGWLTVAFMVFYVGLMFFVAIAKPF